MIDDYIKAKKQGDAAFNDAVHEGRNPYLAALDQFLDEKSCDAVDIGTMEIPVSLITGTKTAGRQQTFACNFMPVLDKDTEFGTKWSRLYESQISEGLRDPILVYEYLHHFYVQEGNKRVSVAKYVGMPTIAANVKRLVKREETAGNDIYDEFLKFFSVCPLYELNFTKKGSYLEFAQALGKDLKTRWDEITVSRVRSAYHHFSQAYKNVEHTANDTDESDAFLTYISIYGFDSLRQSGTDTLRRNIVKIRKELQAQTSKDTISFREVPAEKKDTPLSDLVKILPLKPEVKPIRIAFIYDKNAEDSAWIYDHEIGRMYLNKKFKDQVTTEVYENCNTSEKLKEALDQAAASCSMVFTISPSMMKETLKAAIAHPKAKFLNCSINLSANAVRTYYVRMYEVKFLLGALSAMYAKNHKVCYIADYPIYGTIASINAFAIGASLIDPECKVYLGWSGVHDQKWFSLLDDLDISIFSAEDLVSLKEDHTVFGLCRKEKDGSITNLAMPVINWPKYYEKLVEQVLEGTWNQEKDPDKKAVNYWWGMNSDVLDLVISSRISYSSVKMIHLLKEAMMSGNLNPFSGELRSTEKIIQDQNGAKLSNEKIINMDWLNENVIGVIPQFDELNESGRKLSKVSGVDAAKEKI